MEVSGHSRKDSELSFQHEENKIDLCIPEHCCPKRFPTLKFSSPTSCLPEEELEILERKIYEANQLLLKLSLADDISQEESFQQVFDGIIGLETEVITGEEQERRVEGRVTLVGFDFVVLRCGKQEWIVPFSSIKDINITGRFADLDHDPKLARIDPCFRRDVAYHFGEVVSGSPELLQIFFRIRLNIYLLLVEAKRIKIFLDDVALEGLLTDVDKETIALQVDGDMKVIPLERMTLIEVT